MAQDYPNIEHIVVDGGSKDGTVGILRKYTHIKWVSEKDRGQTHALNKGLRMARGGIIGWLNSDDTYLKGAVAASAKYFLDHPDVDLVYSRVNIIDENDNIVGEHFNLPYSHFVQLNFANCIPQQGVFFRKTLIDEVGFFDEKLKYTMDYDYWVRVGKKKKIARICETHANFRIVRGTKTFDMYDLFFEEAIGVSKKHGGHPYYLVLKRLLRRLLVRLGILEPMRNFQKRALQTVLGR